MVNSNADALGIIFPLISAIKCKKQLRDAIRKRILKYSNIIMYA